MKRNAAAAAPDRMRCAVYTRKSTEEGLDQDFNSLDAQRESGEAYIRSLHGEGWTCLPERYDDGGFTGGNMERPAVRRLMVDIEAGKVDCVVVYKVERLSRSLLDFARLMEVFDRRRVSFVSVTQQFNTASSMGRLVLNVLLSFAQFEREIISERTRDKIAAARRKGKWSGGKPVLGYDVEPGGRRLTVNDAEAEQVRAIYRLFLEHHSLRLTTAELNRRGWRTKRWTTRRGPECGGQPFTPQRVYRLLCNVVYMGKLRYKHEIHAGEHAGIVDPDTWQAVRDLLTRNGKCGGPMQRNKHFALLRGLLRCTACDAAMTHAYTSKRGAKLYRYYVCARAQKHGWNTCPAKSVPAGEIERFVVEQLRRVGRDQALVRAAVREAFAQQTEELQNLRREQQRLEREIRQWRAEAAQIAAAPDGSSTERIRTLHERSTDADTRLADVRRKLGALEAIHIDDGTAAAAFADFGKLWDNLAPRERLRLVQLLVARVDYDGAKGSLAIAFHAAGIQTFATQNVPQEVAP